MERSVARGDVVMGSMVYNKTIRLLLNAVRETHGIDLEVEGAAPSARFANLVDQLRSLLSSEASRLKLARTLDIEPSSVEEMSEGLVDAAMGRGKAPRIDEIPPKAVLNGLYAVAHRRGAPGAAVDVPLVDFLREVLDAVFEERGLPGRLQVRGNDTWWRLLRYLRECEEDTHWGESRRGFWLKNAAGRGKVARWPAHPSRLKLTIRKDWL